MKRVKRFQIPQIGLNVRMNCLVAILLGLTVMLGGCGETGSEKNGDQASEIESAGRGGMGDLIVKAESSDENVIYMAEKAEDSLQVPKDHFIRGITESGTLWGTDMEGNIWGMDSLPEELNAEEARKIFVSGDEICILYAAQSDRIVVTDQRGERKGNIDFDGGIVENIVSGDYAIYRSGERGGRVGVCSLDIKASKKGEDLHSLPEDTRGLLERGSDSENLYLYTGETVYRYSLKEGVCYSVFSWTEAGLVGASVFMVWKDGDDYYAMADMTMTTYRISQKRKEEIPKKKEIVIASLQSDPNLSKLVVDFNKSQDEYHVTIRMCQEDSNVTSREDAYTKLNASLLGTDPPDLLYLSNIWYGDELAEHGYLEDLKPFLASSERIGVDDFYPELISYGTCGDVLYTIPYYFQFDTIIALASDRADASGWTYAQMLKYLKEKSEYNPLGAFVLMRLFLLQNTIDYFVDEEQGKAYFDSPEFLEFLAYMKECREKEGMMDPDRRRIMWQQSCARLSDFGTKEEDYGEEYAFVGYPSPDGTMRTILRGDLEFAIVSNSENKEGAWLFMEDFLSSEPAEKGLWRNQLFSNQNTMQKYIDRELALYGQEYEEIIDEEGNVTRNYSDHSITQAHVDNFEKTLAAGRKVSAVNMVLGAIVREEAEYYFSGTKSAEEVAKIIQNKANLYLEEHR